jgi:hypothetical protein
MTLAEWAKGWPYVVRPLKDGDTAVFTPDSAHDEAYRAKAWHLSDYRVSSVSGGSIWFIPR